MKKLIVFIAAFCMALPAVAAPKKDDKEKDKKTAKEMPPQMWNVVVEGATGDTAAQEVKGFLALMKDVKVESCEIKDKTVEAVISSKMKISRADVSKALKEKKELKLKDFKLKRPDKDADKKEEPKKPDAKPGDKTEEPKKPDAKKEEPKKADPAKVEPKKEESK